MDSDDDDRYVRFRWYRRDFDVLRRELYDRLDLRLFERREDREDRDPLPINRASIGLPLLCVMYIEAPLSNFEISSRGKSRRWPTSCVLL